MADEQQENTSYKIAQEVSWIFFVSSVYTISFFEGSLSDEVTLFIILREDIQNALRVLFGDFTIPDECEFTSSDDTQRWHLYYCTPKFLYIRILEMSTAANSRRECWQLDRRFFSCDRVPGSPALLLNQHTSPVGGQEHLCTRQQTA